MVKHVRAVAPPPHGCSVDVRRLPLAAHGYTSKARRRFLIEIDEDLSPLETEWVLIHEWAHMLDWRPYHPLSGDHGPTWAIWQGAIYRAYYGVL